MQEIERSTAEISSLLLTAKRMACRYGQIGLAEPDDIAQNSMLKLLRKPAGNHTTRGWLFMAVRCSAVDAARKASRERRFLCQNYEVDLGRLCEQIDEYCYLGASAPYVVREDCIEIDLMPRLKNMLEKLSKPLKQVLVLHAEGYSYQEIARLTNTNIGTVRSRLHYARRRAKNLLGDMA